jgi:hypothetical protein
MGMIRIFCMLIRDMHAKLCNGYVEIGIEIVLMTGYMLSRHNHYNHT